jgi:amidohydrolase
MSTLLARARTFETELIELRRDLHQHPELAFQEERTAALAARRAAALGFTIRTGVGKTGVVADLEHGSGPTIALRADMDALPITEENDVAYRSITPGIMHACGHDAHVAMLIGAARLLADAMERGELPGGTIRLLFQPAEEASDAENFSGAARIIEAGAMRGVDAVFGLHVGAHLQSGKLFTRSGPIMAGADGFTATVLGESAHAARPHEGVDAVVLAAHAVLACQNAVARRIDPFAQGVLTIGKIGGGVAENVIAERVALEGTVRYFDEEIRAALHTELRRALDVVRALGGEAELDLRHGYPPVVNDVAMTEILTAAGAETLGPEAVTDFEPMMGAEDFSLLLQQAPGSFAWIGAALEPAREHHHPRFDIDESALARGASTLAAAALRALREIRS